MDETIVKSRIKAANPSPRPPGTLVEQTIARGRAIELGRAAEHMLEAQGKAPPGEDTPLLMARVVLGRLAMVKQPTANLSPETLAEQLAGNERFRARLNQPVDKLLSDAQSGRLLKALTKAPSQNPATPKTHSPPQEEKGGLVGP